VLPPFLLGGVARHRLVQNARSRSNSKTASLHPECKRPSPSTLHERTHTLASFSSLWVGPRPMSNSKPLRRHDDPRLSVPDPRRTEPHSSHACSSRGRVVSRARDVGIESCASRGRSDRDPRGSVKPGAFLPFRESEGRELRSADDKSP